MMTDNTLTAPSVASAEQRSIQTIEAAFATDPGARWIFPDPRQFHAHFPEFIRRFAGKAFDGGTADSTADYSGAALWFPPGVYPEEEAIVEFLNRTVPQRRQADVLAMLELMGRFHPETPHWYLAMLAVAPARQRQGLGSELLVRGLRRCDEEGCPAYLESSNPRNIAFYERHGFEIIGSIQVADSPEIVPMLRRPRGG